MHKNACNSKTNDPKIPKFPQILAEILRHKFGIQKLSQKRKEKGQKPTSSGCCHPEIPANSAALNREYLQIPLPKLLKFFTAVPQQDLEQLVYLALLLETRFWGPKNFRTEPLLKDS
jgi:hypothetical protein